MRIFVGAVLACAALVGTARADTYCVSPATGCDHTATSIQNGLTQTTSHAGDDTVQLGATTYNLDTDADASANALTYPTSGAQGKVTLRGVGPGQTTVTRSLAVASSEALIGGTLNSTGARRRARRSRRSAPCSTTSRSSSPTTPPPGSS